MTNHVVQTCFAFAVTPEEERDILQAKKLADELYGTIDTDSTLRFWNQLPDEFRAKFPPVSEDPWSGFLAIFPDPSFPEFGVAFEAVTRSDDTRAIMIYGDQFDPEATANLLACLVTSSLPITATWSASASKHRLDEFNGGGFRIAATGIDYRTSQDIYRTDLFEPSYVLSTLDPDEGLLFWNSDNGFGDLANATTFTDAEAKAQPAVIAGSEPEWLELPRCLNA